MKKDSGSAPTDPESFFIVYAEQILIASISVTILLPAGMRFFSVIALAQNVSSIGAKAVRVCKYMDQPQSNA